MAAAFADVCCFASLQGSGEAIVAKISSQDINQAEGPLKLYDRMVADGKLQSDTHQRHTVEGLQNVYSELQSSSGFLSKVSM